MRYGLVGAGGIGRIRADALNGMTDCALVAVTDVDLGKARNLVGSSPTKVYETFEALLAATEVEAVIISVPPQFHEAQVIAALQAGKHVLCEKPLAPSVEACRRMVGASRAANRVLTTGFNHRYFSAVQDVKQAIASKTIGTLDHIRAFAGHTGLSEFKAPWMYDKDIMGGGALMDVGIHMIDLIHYLLGDIHEVQGIATGKVWKLDRSEDNGIALLRNCAGVTALFQATWTEWKGYRFSIEAYGDKGMAGAYYAPMRSLIITMNEPGGKPKKSHNFYVDNIFREKFSGWQSTVIRTFQQEFRDFVGLCAGRTGIIANGFDGCRAVEVADAIYRCSETGQPVRLSEGKKETP